MNKSRQALYDIFMSQTVTELQLHRKYFDAYRVKSSGFRERSGPPGLLKYIASGSISMVMGSRFR